jgi:hypothetical protein
MTAAVPEPIPLEMPPGDPAAVEELVRDVAGAASLLAVLTDELSGPAASAPGWLGDDASAAEAQVVRIAGIVREAAAAVLRSTGRLSAHGELLGETRRGVDALRAEQDEDFRAAWRRLGQIEDPRLAVMTGSAAWVGVIEEIEASEASRRRRHATLVEELRSDARATAGVLADAAGTVGGTGRPGDAGRVLAHLAAELPGWGNPELTARGRVLADALVRSSMRPAEREALATEAAALAGNPVFASALVRGLGENGVAGLLVLLGQDPDGPDNPMAALLASALGAAVPGEGEHDGVSAVLGATYVQSDDRYGPSDTAAAGMAAVLSAGTRAAGGGLRMVTVAEWARQLLVREHVQKLPGGLPPAGAPWRRDAFDPAGLAVGLLARGGEPAVAAALLADQRVWEVALLRFWDDGGTALGELIEAAGRHAGPAGDRAVRLGLETIGAGLLEGDPSDRTVDRDNVEAVAPALGEAVAAHVTVVTGDLAAAASGEVDAGAEQLLKGLGYVSVDQHAAASVETALRKWSLAQPLDLTGTGPATPDPAVAVPSAFLAVQDIGQRLSYALDGYELQDEARDKEAFWNWTAGLALELVSYVPVAPVAVLADVVNAYGPILLDMDGTFDQGKDRGLRFDAAEAARNVLAALPPDRAAEAYAVGVQAEAAFRRTTEALGVPVSPESPPEDWVGATLDLVSGGLADAMTDEVIDRADRGGPHGGLLPGRR